MPADLVAGNLAFLREFVDRRLRQLQVDDEFVDREDGISGHSGATGTIARCGRLGATGFPTGGSHGRIRFHLTVVVNCYWDCGDVGLLIEHHPNARKSFTGCSPHALKTIQLKDSAVEVVVINPGALSDYALHETQYL